MKSIINLIIIRSLVPILWLYERYIMYRIREAWGLVHLRNIRNKGSNNKIVGYSRFLDENKLYLGSGIRIGYGCFFFCKGEIHIGDYTIISRNVTIYSANHNYKSNIMPYDETYVLKPVRIGRAVWIGMNVSILPGVTIGDGAIIGMGSVVRRNVSAGEIYIADEGVVLKERDMVMLRESLSKEKFLTSIYPDI